MHTNLYILVCWGLGNYTMKPPNSDSYKLLKTALPKPCYDRIKLTAADGMTIMEDNPFYILTVDQSNRPVISGDRKRPRISLGVFGGIALLVVFSPFVCLWDPLLTGSIYEKHSSIVLRALPFILWLLALGLVLYHDRVRFKGKLINGQIVGVHESIRRERYSGLHYLNLIYEFLSPAGKQHRHVYPTLWTVKSKPQLCEVGQRVKVLYLDDRRFRLM